MLLAKEQLDRISQKLGAEVIFKDGFYWLTVDGKKVPLYPWRQIMRLMNMRKSVLDRSIYDISVMKSECVEQRCFSILSLTMRECEICQWLLGDAIASVFAQTDNKNVLHMIARMKSGVLFSLDLTNGLNEGTRETNRHEIISSVGELCDLPVGMQYAAEDTYVFNSDLATPTSYTEVIIEDVLYTREEAQLIRDALTLINDEKAIDERIKSFEGLEKIAEIALKSSDECRRLEVSL